MKILEVVSLTKCYGKRVVVSNLTFSISEGKVFGLLGPNGAGKTTTINCIFNLEDIDSGQIKIFGEELDGNEIEIKRKIGILFENMENLFVHLRGEEQLNFTAEIYGLDKAARKKRIEELLDFFDLTDHRSKMIDDYSKGMKKKIALASVLLVNPDFIILDEPFDGLDALTVSRLKKLIRRLKTRGKTILITSHILSYIEDVADEVAIINKGKLVYQSDTKDIRSKIRNEITRETYSSLEEVFLDLTSETENNNKNLSWL